MLTRRTFFKSIAAFALAALFFRETQEKGPALSPVFAHEGSKKLCLAHQPQHVMPFVNPLTIELEEDFLDDVDCMELAERYGTFETVGGYLGGFLAGQCTICGARDWYVNPNEIDCDRCRVSDAVDFFARVENLTYTEAEAELRWLVGTGILNGRQQERELLWGIMDQACRYYHNLLCESIEGRLGREWLAQYGVENQTTKKLFLGYFPASGNGMHAELIHHLLATGYPPEMVESAILPCGYESILLPVQDAQGHCWGFLKRRYKDGSRGSWYGSLLGMQRLAPRQFQKFAASVSELVEFSFS